MAIAAEPRPNSVSPEAARKLRSAETPRRRLVADRAARWVVSAGGLAIIVSVLGILFFIVAEVLPLTRPARVEMGRKLALAGPEPGALVSDEHRTHAAALAADGKVRVVRFADAAVLFEQDILAPAAPAASTEEPAAAPAPAASGPVLMAMKVPAGTRALSGSTRDGRVVLAPVAFDVTFEGQSRVVTPRVAAPVVLTLDPAGRPLGEFAIQVDEEGGATAAAELADGTLAVVRRSASENMMTGEVTESIERHVLRVGSELTALAIDRDQRALYGGTAQGELIWWPLQDGVPGQAQTTPAGAPVTSLNLLIGGRSVIVGQRDGSISTWLLVQRDDGPPRLTRVRDFPRHSGAVTEIAPSERDKGFVALSETGELGLYYSTSHRTLWTGRAPLQRGHGLFYAPKNDGIFLSGEGQVAEIEVYNPHPEVTWRTLFGKTWYEGYEKPEYVWQSTGGTDDFEPKLSLTPLLVGTLKGTFYSLLLAIPLGVFGAMYTSQFMHPVYKRYLKPMIEIMAALPSVVLGFLAGLWLAPRIEQAVPALALMLVVLPLLVLLAGYLWSRLPRAVRGRFPVGSEAILFVFVLAGGIWLCLQVSQPFEELIFGGNFQGWLLQATGLTYDQRNAVVVGLAMGFAVIPIIFAIAEDAFSNVPTNLVAGSLALGADRWQTVTRVVLPTASPGIFSAIMVGFGRAVGETMIVLMATGNTPIMEWNPFNGFRTLSANIAVEIPEAPHGGTLYRTLFLAGLLLFIITFLINTVAEIVRQRLRERYSQL
ncbi:MAG TPA: ABC transporter permease subunit [Thermoanaerobaculia bacterium]|nr:ABC transporter permease subunit [Thermoanaerobaculia bacterium]